MELNVYTMEPHFKTNMDNKNDIKLVLPSIHNKCDLLHFLWVGGSDKYCYFSPKIHQISK
jgi:hypothetical protein